MKVYIAGPMRGHEFFNFAAFDQARDTIKELGHTPVSPADLSRQMVECAGYDPTKEESFSFFKPEDYMERDICELRGVDGIVLLPGWTNSKGVQVEIAYARYRGIPIYSSVEQFELLECVKQAA